MKKLNRLQISIGKLLKNEELLTLKGGEYDGGYCGCRIDNSTCAADYVGTCEGTGYGSCQQYCAYYCPSYTDFICIGG